MELIGKLLSNSKAVRIEIANNRIAKITPIENHAEDLPWIAPPLVDIQINGFGGFDLNSENVVAEDVVKMIKTVRKFGTGFVCPTIVTGSHDRMSRSISAIVEACENEPEIDRAIIGIHVEGPYISPEDGPRGAHPKKHVRIADLDEFQKWQDLAEGRIKILTLAPEVDHAIEMIEKVAESGVVVAIGHTNAEPQIIRRAISAGAKLSTHLGNAAHAQIRRHPNYIWEQLAADELHASLIVDGHHLPPSVVKVMLRAKGLERSILISDAVHLAGMSPGRYHFSGREVELTSDHCVRLCGTSLLAGSAIPLINGVENSVKFAEISLRSAFDLATVQPAKLLGIDDQIGQIREGEIADLLVFDWDADQFQIEFH